MIWIIWCYDNDCQYRVLSLNVFYLWNFPSALHTSLLPSWKSTQGRDWSEKEKELNADEFMTFFLLCCTQHAVDFCDALVLIEHMYSRSASFEISLRSMFLTFWDRLPVVLKLVITMITAPNCTSWQHWPKNGPCDLCTSRTDFGFFELSRCKYKYQFHK